jgi:hypothetical protein
MAVVGSSVESVQRAGLVVPVFDQIDPLSQMLILLLPV